jgi:predicted P-loop ATPase
MAFDRDAEISRLIQEIDDIWATQVVYKRVWYNDGRSWQTQEVVDSLNERVKKLRKLGNKWAKEHGLFKVEA